MNSWQVARQIQHLLRTRTWTGSSTAVFHPESVYVTVAPDANAAARMIPPVALVRPLDAQSDPAHDEEPDYLRRGFAVRLMTSVPHDDVGQSAVIGAARVGQTDSRNRGLLEIEEELFAAVERLNSDTGVEIQHRATGAAEASLDENVGYLVWADYSFEAIVTADRFYHPAAQFSATGGAGSVSMTWRVPPDRFDRFRMVLRRASGATAPTSISGGTGVVLSGNLATSVTDSGLVAGTYSYALFATYDETNTYAGNSGAAADQRVSASRTATVVVS